MPDESRRPACPPTLRVTVFAGLAEAVGGRCMTLPWPGGRVVDLRAAVVDRAPAAAALVSRSAVVIDGRHAADHDPVASDADVAILPPVSGG